MISRAGSIRGPHVIGSSLGLRDFQFRRTIACLLCNILEKHSSESGGISVFVLRVRDASVISNCDGGGHPRSSRFEVVRRNYPQRAGRRGRENAEQGPGGISGDMGDLLSICGMRLRSRLKLLVGPSLATFPYELRLALCSTTIFQRSQTG
jgi:hypothetical protein